MIFWSISFDLIWFDLVWCYKILFGVVDMPVADFFEVSLVKHTHGHSATPVQGPVSSVSV